MRDIVLNLSEQTLSKIGSCDYSNIVRGCNNYLRIVLKTDIQWNNMAQAEQQKQPHMKVVLLQITQQMEKLLFVIVVLKTFGVTFGNSHMV